MREPEVQVRHEVTGRVRERAVRLVVYEGLLMLTKRVQGDTEPVVRDRERHARGRLFATRLRGDEHALVALARLHALPRVVEQYAAAVVRHRLLL